MSGAPKTAKKGALSITEEDDHEPSARLNSNQRTAQTSEIEKEISLKSIFKSMIFFLIAEERQQWEADLTGHNIHIICGRRPLTTRDWDDDQKLLGIIT